jgi:hypothetical protein
MVRIIFMNPPGHMPSEMADLDGFYSLDLNDGERIALTKVIDDYIDIGSIKQDTFKEMKAPFSKKNRLLLEGIGNPSAFNQDNSKIFPIQLLKGDFSYPVNGLQVLSNSDQESGYSFKIFGEINKWYKPLQNLKLNELELGSHVVDRNYLFNTLMATNYQYDEAIAPVFPPLVNYGSWFIESTEAGFGPKSQVVFENFRFWHSPKAILDQAFCQIGWKLVAPMMENEEFLRHWTYTLDPEFETVNDADILNRPLEVERPTVFFFEVLFQRISGGFYLLGVLNYNATNVVSDPGSHFLNYPPVIATTSNYYGGFYSGGIVGNFHAEGTVRINLVSGSFFIISPNFITLKISILKSYRYGLDDQQALIDNSTVLVTKKFIQKGIITAGVPIDFDYSIDTGSVKVYRNEVVFVRVEYLANLVDGGGTAQNETFLYDQTTILAGSKFSCSVEKQVLEDGDLVEWGLLLNRNINCLDYFKGIAHLYNWKIDQDSIQKIVYAYPESKFDWYLSGVQEGYFKDNTDNPVDATPIIQAKSMQQGFPNTQLQREVYLKFIDSTDGYILDKLLEQELYSKKIDLGPKFMNGENEITNPFFEPLGSGIDLEIAGVSISFGPGDIRPSSNWISFMWESQSTDGAYPLRGYDFAPRIAIAYPRSNPITLQPSLTGQADPTILSYVYEDMLIPFGEIFLQIGPDGLSFTPVFVPGPDQAPDLAVVYGNDFNPAIEDLWTFIYSNSVNQAYFNIALNFLVLVDLITFSNISFRRKWKVKYLSSAWGEIYFFARLSRVTDYSIGDNITTPVELIPDNNNFMNC